MTAKEYFQFRRDQIEIEAAENLEKRLTQINAYTTEQLEMLIAQDAQAKQVEPTDSVDDKRRSLLERAKHDIDSQKKLDLQRVATDEKDRQTNMTQIEPGSWVTIHWFIPFRERTGQRKQRAATISGEVQSVQLDRGQVTFRCNSRPDEDEFNLHNIKNDSVVEAPLDSVTSVSL